MIDNAERRLSAEEAAFRRRAHDAFHNTEALTFPTLLEILGYRDDEHVAVCSQPAGGVFSSQVMPPGAAPDYVVSLGDGVNVWVSVNPTKGPRETGRGTEADVTRLAALFADLDVKPGACRDFEHAEAIVTEVSALIGQRPRTVVYSGHGLQPYWPLEDGEITKEFPTAAAKSLLTRFGRLVAIVAEHHGAAVDSVWDLARVLRVPGSTNWKSQPVPVTGLRDVGGPLSIAEVDERLTELGIDHQADDEADRCEVSPPSGWVYAANTCAYVRAWLDSLPTDGPNPGGGRNPWAASQMVRLACAVRLGCISEADTRSATTILATRLATLLATTEPRRALRQLEMRDLARLGQRRAAEKNDDEARAELGNHVHHSDNGTAEGFWGTVPGSPPPPPALAPAVEPAPARQPNGIYAGHVLTRSALRYLPDPQPLIERVLDRGTAALLYGHRGTLKSFVALDWAASVSTGRPWQGRPVQRGRALYVAAEGAFGLKSRVDAWEVGWRVTIGDDDLAVLPHPVNLGKQDDVAELAMLIESAGFEFVVLDTLARCMVGADENSARDCGLIIDALYRLQGATPGRRGVVLGVHHTGKDQKTLRGSSAFEAGVDTVYSMTRDGGTVTLNREKRKDGPEADRHELRLDLIAGTNSGVIGAQNPSTWGVERSPRAAALLATFRHHFSTSGATKSELKAVAGMSDGTFYRALDDLLKRSDLVNEGTDQRTFYRAVQQ